MFSQALSLCGGRKARVLKLEGLRGGPPSEIMGV